MYFKKTMDLVVVCDLQAYIVIIDDDGEIVTWLKNQDEEKFLRSTKKKFQS